MQKILALIYLPVHIFVLPLLFQLYGSVAPAEIPQMTANMVYYGMGLAFVLIVLLSFLRDGFDLLVERLRDCVLTLLLSMGLIYLLEMAVSMLLLALGEQITNPVTAETTALAAADFYKYKALAVFIGPIVEEVLFRGALFGTLRERNRIWAYVLSALVFSIYHVWQLALVSGDWTVLLYALQYVPVSVVLAWSYERTGCIWVPIFFHMGYNNFSFALLEALM